MLRIKNKIIPPPGIKALTIWPLVFVRSMYMTQQDWRHEEIHGRQQMEMLVIGAVFFLLLLLCGCGWWSMIALPLYFWIYGLFYLWGLLFWLDSKLAYKRNPFEWEAYFFEGDSGYLERRRWFGWWQFFKY